MAYHVESGKGIIFETSCVKAASRIVAAIAEQTIVVEGPVEFLRGRAQRKFGQTAKDYPVSG